MAFHINSFLSKIPNQIHFRALYHVIILLANFTALIHFIDSTFGKKTTFQKFFFFTCWNQIFIIIYYVWVFFYNIILYIYGDKGKCPRNMLNYLRVSLSISSFVALSYFLMKNFFPWMIIPPNKENLVQISFIVDLWVHFFNFFFLCFELAFEKNRKFAPKREKLFHIFISIVGIYSVALLTHNLIYGTNVYPFLKNINTLLGSLLAVVVIGSLYALDQLFSFIMEALWKNSN